MIQMIALLEYINILHARFVLVSLISIWNTKCMLSCQGGKRLDRTKHNVIVLLIAYSKNS